MSGPAGAEASALSSDNLSTAGRILGVVRRPRSTFEAVVRSPRWAGLLALLFAVYFVVSAALLRDRRRPAGPGGSVGEYGHRVRPAGRRRPLRRVPAAQRARIPYAALTALATGPAGGDHPGRRPLRMVHGHTRRARLVRPGAGGRRGGIGDPDAAACWWRRRSTTRGKAPAQPDDAGPVVRDGRSGVAGRPVLLAHRRVRRSGGWWCSHRNRGAVPAARAQRACCCSSVSTRRSPCC